MAEPVSPVRIRPARPSDGAACSAIYAPFVTDTFVSMETVPPDAAEMSARIVKTLEAFPWLVADADGETLGYAYASRHRERASYRWSCEVTVYLGPEARGRGIARALYTELLDVLARQGFHMAWAGIALPNPASIKFHESMGFAPIGVYRETAWKLGAWRDVGYWGRRLGVSAGEPAEPLLWPDLERAQATGSIARKSSAKPPSK